MGKGVIISEHIYAKRMKLKRSLLFYGNNGSKAVMSYLRDFSL